MSNTNNVLTPSQVVAELDKYIIGQNDAKRAVAIALKEQVAQTADIRKFKRRNSSE